MNDKTIDISSSYVHGTFSDGLAVPAVSSGGVFRMVSMDRVLCYKGSVNDVDKVSGIGIFVPTSDCLNCPKTPNTSDIIISLAPNGSYGIILYMGQSGSGIYWCNLLGDHRGQWRKITSELIG